MKRCGAVGWFLGALVLWMHSGILSAQGVDFATQKTKVLGLERKLDSLRVSRARLVDQADVLAHKIELLRARGLLSPHEHRKLERKLQESQLLEGRVRTVEVEIAEADSVWYEAVTALVEAYRSGIQDIVRVMEETEDAQEKERLVLRFRGLLEEKQEWEERLPPDAFSSQPVFEVGIEPWDGPREIRMKGDILLDQEETLRQEILLVENRIRSLQEEERVRRKVKELTDEMEIFDEGEELVGREAESVEQKRTFRGTFVPMAESDVDVKGQSLRRDMRLEMTRPTSQTLLTIPELIEALEMYREQLMVRADSLKEKAAWFYEKAAEGRR